MLVIDSSKNAMVYISNGNGFAGPYQWSVDGKMILNSSNSDMVTRTGDFDGDGLTDIISVDKVNKKTYVWTSNGSGFTLHEDWFPGDNPGNNNLFDLGDFNGDGMTDVIRISQYARVWFATGGAFNLCSYGELGNNVSYGWKIWDMNGDGKSDVLCTDGARFSTGFGFKLSSSTPGYYAQLADFNGDGILDGSDYSSGGFRVCMWNGNSYTGYSWTVDGANTIQIPPADFNGDGKAEICIQNGTEIDVFVPVDTTKEDVIASITDGLGKQTTITYKPITDSTVYQKYNDAMYPTIRDYQGGMHVVSQCSISDGLGGATAYSYTYAGARIDTARKELLGFQRTTIKDLQTNLSTTSTYLQGFPFGGLLKTRIVSLISGENESIINEITNDYNVQCYDSGILTETKSEAEATEWFIYNSPGITSKSYFPYPALTGSVEPITSSTEEYSYLDYGNLQQKITTIATKTGGTTTDTFQQIDTFLYYPNDFTNWIIGLMSQQASQAANNQEVSEPRTKSYQYDTTHRLLTRDITEPSGGQGVKLTRDYEYTDAYFNNTKITETGYNGTDTENRITTFSYAYDAVEFHITKTNSVGLVEIYDHDWATGKATTYTDPNGLMTNWYYDDFGRLAEEERPDNSKTIYTFSIGGPGTGAVYSIKTQVFDNNNIGLAPTTTSFDKLDREIYQETQAQNGQIVFRNTLYNNRGLIDTQSRYHFSGGNAQNTTFIYDALGRVTSQTAYNSGTTTYAYNISGYNNSSVTNANNQTTTQTSNAIGKLCQVVDPLGKTTSYTYTPFGDLKQVKDSLNNTTNLIYDIRGRRTQVQDPDMGIWNYTYNSFGDLVSQTDARGTIVQMTYDMLSRIKTKTSGGQTYI
jgi:YD repeat-containing protein